jgi:dolichol-phosphate mannosyltransferase
MTHDAAPATPPPPADEPSSNGDPLASVIIPTYKEAENIPLIVPAVHEALQAADIHGEIIIVDDNSNDGTIGIVDGLKAEHPVTLLTRTDERGLATAVIAGFDMAHGEILVCMDADGSHPPAKVPEIIRAINGGETEFVIGSRYVQGASTDAEWSLFRALNSKVATLLSRPLTSAKDPMSGFFGVKRSVYQRAAKLDPIGYKIALELLVKCGVKRPMEIPIHFADRQHGESKLSMKEIWNYVRHVLRLMGWRLKGGAKTKA